MTRVTTSSRGQPRCGSGRTQATPSSDAARGLQGHNGRPRPTRAAADRETRGDDRTECLGHRPTPARQGRGHGEERTPRPVPAAPARSRHHRVRAKGLEQARSPPSTGGMSARIHHRTRLLRLGFIYSFCCFTIVGDKKGRLTENIDL